MAHATDIVGYMYRADLYCPDHIIDVLATGEGEDFDGWALAEGAAPMTVENNLAEIATAFGIDHLDESSYDSDYFPKVVFRSSLEGDEYCGHCHEQLGE